jgi:hypothetical protein
MPITSRRSPAARLRRRAVAGARDCKRTGAIDDRHVEHLRSEMQRLNPESQRSSMPASMTATRPRARVPQFGALRLGVYEEVHDVQHARAAACVRHAHTTAAGAQRAPRTQHELHPPVAVHVQNRRGGHVERGGVAKRLRRLRPERGKAQRVEDMAEALGGNDDERLRACTAHMRGWHQMETEQTRKRNRRGCHPLRQARARAVRHRRCRCRRTPGR